MENKECTECTVNNTVYEVVRQTDTSTACGGCVACHHEDIIDKDSIEYAERKALCYLLDACVTGCKLYHVWTLKEIK